MRDVWRGTLHFHFRSSLVGVIRLGILDCFYQSNKNGVVGSRWSPERMCTVDFSMATSRTQYLTPLGIEGLPLVLQMLAVHTDYSFLLPGCCNVRLLLHRHSLQDEIVNLSPLSATCKNMLRFCGAGKAHHPNTLSMQTQLFCVCCFFIFLEGQSQRCAGHGTVFPNSTYWLWSLPVTVVRTKTSLSLSLFP